MFTVRFETKYEPYSIQFNQKLVRNLPIIKRKIKHIINKDKNLSKDEKLCYLLSVDSIDNPDVVDADELVLKEVEANPTNSTSLGVKTVRSPERTDSTEIRSLLEDQAHLIYQLQEVISRTKIWAEKKHKVIEQAKLTIAEQESTVIDFMKNPLGTSKGLNDLFNLDVTDAELDLIKLLLNQ